MRLVISRTLDCGCAVTTGGDRIWCGKCQEANIILQDGAALEKLSRENSKLRTENATLTKQKKFCLDRIEELVKENKSLQSSLFLSEEQIERDKEQVTALYAEITIYQNIMMKMREALEDELKPVPARRFLGWHSC